MPSPVVKNLTGMAGTMGSNGTTAKKPITVTISATGAGTFTGTLSTSSPIVTAVSSLTGLVIGSTVTATGITGTATIIAMTSNSVTLDRTPTAAGSVTLTYATNNKPTLGDTIWGVVRLSGGGQLDPAAVISGLTNTNGIIDPRGNTWTVDDASTNGTGINIAFIKCRYLNAYTDGDVINIYSTVSAAYNSTSLVELDVVLTSAVTASPVTRTGAVTTDSAPSGTTASGQPCAPTSTAQFVAAGVATGGTSGSNVIGVSTGWTLLGAGGTGAQNSGIALLNSPVSGTAPSLTWSWGPSSADTTVMVAYTQTAVVDTPPTANAGPDQSVLIGHVAQLDGTASTDPDTGDSVASYLWSITSAPLGSTATLSSTTAAKPTITPDKVGNYVISLEVFDTHSTESIAADTVTITGDVTTIKMWTGTEWSRFKYKMLLASGWTN